MRKLYFFLVLLLLFTTNISAQKKTIIPKSGNPLFPGWYADPEGVIFNKQYWIYPTFSAPYNQQVYFDVFSSPDLINWTKHKNITDTSKIKWAKRAMWAPAIIKNKNKYFLFFGANDIQSDKESGGIGVAVANKPQGPFTDLIGKPLVDKFHNGAQPIDQFYLKLKDRAFLNFWIMCIIRVNLLLVQRCWYILIKLGREN
jgi:beta-xylosidase